jgi:predicted amidohydrolase YtcJ
VAGDSHDIILHNGVVLTMDEQRPQATAIALRDGRVLAVGGDDEVLSLRRDATALLDLDGKTVCPGFIDAHHHFTLAGWCQLGIDLAGCRSAADVCLRIAKGMAGAQTGAWLYAYNYDPRDFTHGTGLTRYDLDRVAGERPVLVMHFSYHEGVVSSAGLALAGIDRRSSDPQGGRIVRDRSGVPTGELLETAIGPVEALARSAAAGAGYEDWLAAIERYSTGLFAAGITHVCDPGVDAMLEGYLRRAQREGRMPLPVTMLFVSGAGLFQPPLDRLVGPRTGEQVDGLSVGALKVFADGGSRCAACARLFESLAGVGLLAARAARMRRPGLLLHAGAPDTPRLGRDGRIRSGYLHYPPEVLAEVCARGSAAGFQVAVHAACNDAIDGVLAAYERLPAGPYPHRVEHLVSLDATQAHRLAATGATGVVQPAYVLRLGDEIDAMPAPPRLRSIPLRMLLDAGVPLSGSSDAPVAPYSPLEGMRAAITRRTAAGYLHQPSEAITAEEALRLWTTGSARAANAAREIGVLQAGARADVVILSANPLATSPERFDRIRVERTLLGGRTVYAADGVP